MIETTEAARALARKGRGVPRHFTPEELDKRRARLAAVRKFRHARSTPKSKKGI